jgi:cell division transport system permease protein
LYTRREEVLVLKLLGASDAYIVRPFLYSGLLFGLCGVVLALGMAQWVCFRLQPLFSHVFSLYEVHFQGVYVPWIDVMYVAGFALLLGWLGALLAVKRQLASIAALE